MEKNMVKKDIMEIESVYTANAFQIGKNAYVAAGSETTPQVYLYNMSTGKSELVSGCPGGVMSFVPVPGKENVFYSIMGLFPPFIGAEGGLFMHIKRGEEWETSKAMKLPFAHRCDIINRDGKNYLFAVSVSRFKENPADWSKPGEIYQINLDEKSGLPLIPKLIDSSITRNHGMLKAKVNGLETLCVSGAEGIFYFELKGNGNWVLNRLFDKEVSEFGLIDLDGDGEDELVTIEPFHGEHLNVYKRTGGEWKQVFGDTLSFGHGLSCGIFNGEPVIVVGNRRGSFTLDMFRPLDVKNGKFTREVMEEEAGPTQTQVFRVDGTDYILSANQKQNRVALYKK